MIKLAAIADDLTGANDTALQFAKRNIKSCVKINFANDDFTQDKDVIVIDSDSRDLNANEAYEKVHDICSAIKQYDIRCIYKKIDSTLRGNIGAEIKAVDGTPTARWGRARCPSGPRASNWSRTARPLRCSTGAQSASEVWRIAL